jgi:hypothetical protein
MFSSFQAFLFTVFEQYRRFKPSEFIVFSYFLCRFQMDVFHPLMIRNYMRKYDMDEPPKLEEPIDELDNRMKRIKEANADDSALEDKYYRYVLRSSHNSSSSWGLR